MWLLSGRCYCKTRLDGKTVVITGANGGIGKATALDLYRRGARVLMACRDMKRAEEAADDIRAQCKDLEGVGQLVTVRLDLGDMSSIRQCAKDILRAESAVHILINNAGLVFYPKGETKDGFETHIGVNHLGHFLLTCLLLPRMRSSAPARIITMSSCVNYWVRTVHPEDLHYNNRWYHQVLGYMESKLANVMFSRDLGRRLQGTGVTTYSLHPGLVVTNAHYHVDQSWFYGGAFVWEKIMGPFMKTCEQGAQTSIHLAVSEDVAHQTGEYYSDCKLSTANPKVHDAKLQEELWQESVRQVGLQDWDPFTAPDLGS